MDGLETIRFCVNRLGACSCSVEVGTHSLAMLGAGGGSRSPTVAKTASKTKTSSISPRLSSPKAARRPSSAVPSRRAPPRDETKEVRAPSGGGGDVPSATHFLAGQRRPQSANPKTNANTTSVLATVDAAEEGGEVRVCKRFPAACPVLRTLRVFV